MKYSGSVVFDQKWEFGLQGVMDQIEKELVNAMQEALDNSIEDMGWFDWHGADLTFRLATSDAADKSPTWRISLQELVDLCLEWNQDPASEDGQWSLKIASEMEKQAKRLRDAVAEQNKNET